MKTTVVYKCGHEDVIQAYGSNRWRELERCEQILCPACEEAARKKEIEDLRIQAKEKGWPELTGTEKQVNWVLKLREEFVKTLQEGIDPYKEKLSKLQAEGETLCPISNFLMLSDLQEIIDEVVPYFIQNYTESKFFIDKRGSMRKYDVPNWIERLAEEIYEAKNYSDEEWYQYVTNPALWPELDGNEYSVKHGTTARILQMLEIRKDRRDDYAESNESIAEGYVKDRYTEYIAVYPDLLVRFLETQTDASYWERAWEGYSGLFNWKEFVHNLYVESTVYTAEELKHKREMEEEAARLEEQAMREKEERIQRLTVTPESVRHDGVVTVDAADNKVVVTYKKYSDLYREALKKQGYLWDDRKRCWYKDGGDFCKSIQDMAAEIGCILLNAGFVVRFDDEEIKRMAIEADYEPEPEQIIICKGDQIFVHMIRNDSYLQQRIGENVPGARYNRIGKLSYFDLDYYKDMLDYAESNGIAVHEAVLRRIEIRKEVEAQAVAQAIAAVKEPEIVKANSVRHDSGNEILSDLVDD